ncbi:MAG: PKD domain-containing protein [Acidobacteriota bacterium]
MSRTLRTIVALTGVAVLLASCTAKKQEAPPLSGPSELATSITVTASPDTLRQDGASQSQIGVLARDSSGQPVGNLAIRLDVAVGGVVTDFGQISAKNVTTGSDGRANVVYTAPNAPVDPVDAGTVVQILATPLGTDYASAVARTVSIRLVPPGVILPPNGTPTPAFTVSPSAPVIQADVTFDASLSSDADGQIVSYVWSFGDGTSGTGQLATHRYSAGGTYSVTLTVTDDRNLSASVTATVAVTETAVPTADFVFSPTTPIVNETVFFNAAASRAATGRTLVSYDWTLGTGRTASGVTVSKAYGSPGTYNVTLTVTDDIGKRGTASKTVPVTATGSLTAAFTFSPTNPAGAETIQFNGSSSSGVNPIISYAWDFGDGTTATGVTTSHSYASSCPGGADDRTFVVRLTVGDTNGKSATTTQNVVVTACK